MSGKKCKQDDAAQPANGSPDKPPEASQSQHILHIIRARSKLLIVAVSVALVVLSWLVPYGVPSTSTTLDDTYAVCSRRGKSIYTVDENNTKVECMVIHKDRVLNTGSYGEVLSRYSQKHVVTTENFVDGNVPPLQVKYIPHNAIVVPGISDSHGHILEYGANRQLSLDGCKSIDDTVKQIRNFVIANPDVRNDSSHFVEGWGWDHTSWPVEKFPSASDLDLDPILRGRFIILQSKDGHAQWVSKAVLESIGPLPSQVDGGIVLRDANDNPTGVFLDNAQDLVKRPQLTETDLMSRFMITVRDALSLGLTSLHDAGFDPTSLAFFKRRAELGDLPIRIYGMSYFNENAEYWGDKRAKLINVGRLTARSIKIFADGALRSGGAALYEPYDDNPHTKGFMRLSVETLRDAVPRYLKDGWQVNVHAIGDLANGVVLDAFEEALAAVNVTALRPRLEHAQIMTGADIKRLGRLGVIASIQPTHAISDMWFAEERLGPVRVKQLYAFRSLVDSGVRIALGSDFPVEDMNPLAGFFAAITRLSPDGKSPHGPGGWFPEQRLTRSEALRGMTIDPAFASFTEASLGSLEPGKIADYVVLSQDIMEVPVDKILSTKVLATVLDGRPVYGRI